MLNGLVHAHSGLRWIVLILLLVSIFNAFSKKKTGIYSEGDRKLALFTMIFTHVQLLIGFVLYFMSPRVIFSGESMGNDVLRFYLLEHGLLMLVAIALITIGHSKSKKAADGAAKFKAIARFYLIALILILAAIPWPFRDLGGSWF